MKINKSFQLQHFDEREQVVDTIVLHSMFAPMLEAGQAYLPQNCIECLDRFGVSAHYLIAQNGEVFNLVVEDKRAWHAGKSVLPVDGREKVNDFSIGIELISSSELGYSPAQLENLNNLISEICSRHQIRYIYGHRDIACNRKAALHQRFVPENYLGMSEEEFKSLAKDEAKLDPWDFPWDELAEQLRACKVEIRPKTGV